MRIALLTNSFPPEQEYGIARYIEDLAFSLAERGHSVDVFAGAFNPKPPEHRLGFRIIWVSKRKFKRSLAPSLFLLKCSYDIWRKLKHYHQKESYDIVEYPNLEYPGFFTTLFGLPSPSPVLVTRLSSPANLIPLSGLTRFRLSEYVERLQVIRSSACIGNTEENLSVCEGVYHLPPQIKRKVILHGLPIGAQPEYIIKLNDSTRVLFVGRIEPRKGFDVLARCWETVVGAVPDARLVVAGEDKPWKGGESFYNSSIEVLSESAKANIDYLGFVSAATREQLYRECDILVVPSRYESFGMVFLEAMRYGTPVISCRTGGIPEVVEEGVTGVLVPIEDADKLAKAIIDLLVDQEKRLSMGRTAVEVIRERFLLPRVAEESEDFYAELISCLKER